MDRKKIHFKPFVIIFVLIIFLIIAIQLFGAARFETILASHGEIIDGFWSSALIVRDEKVVRSPLSAEVKLFAGEGERIASGEKVAVLKNKNKKQTIYNKEAGLISFAVDGLESKINIDNLDQINLKKFSDYKADYQHLISGNSLDKGEELYRIINNFKLYVVVPVPESEIERFQLGELVFLKEKNSERLIDARIKNIKYSLNKTFFFIEVEQFIPEWSNIRRLNLNIIKNIYRGIKIPRKAVFTQPSGKGVLKVSGYNKYDFKEVVVLNGNDKHVIVSGIEIGEEIITNPEDFNYGRED